MNRRRFLHSTLLLSAGGLSSCRLPDGFAQGHLHAKIKAPLKTAAAASAMLPSGLHVTYTGCKVAGPFIAMTFDDGPHPVLTPRLLDMLREWKLKATFFLIGQSVVTFPKVVSQIVSEGHEVGNHSWNHPQLSAMSDDRVRSQLRRTHDAIVNACGTAPVVFRPPYGAITTRQKQWIAAEFGYPTILWSVDTNDWKDRNSAIVSQRVLEGTRSGSIILTHDIHATTVNAMPDTLPVLRDRGFKFLTVSELAKLEAGIAAAPGPKPAGAEPPPLYSPGAW